MDVRVRAAEEVSHWVIALTEDQKGLVRTLGLEKRAYRQYGQRDAAERAARRLGEAMYGRRL